MKKISVFLLAVWLLTILSIPASATNATPPPMPTISINQTDAGAALPANLGSIIGLVLAGLMVVAVVVVILVKKRKS